MRKIRNTLMLLVLAAPFASASTTYNGSSLVNTPGLADDQIGVYLLSLDGTSFTSGNLSVSDGADITTSGAYASSFQVLSFGSVFTFGDTQLGANYQVTYGGGVDAGDTFAVLVFGSNNPTGGSSYQIFTDDSWFLPADSGGTVTYGTGITQQTDGTNLTSGAVIPEPSAALLSGLGLMLLLRRRRGNED